MTAAIFASQQPAFRPPQPPLMTLAFSEGNILTPAGIENAPEWFTSGSFFLTGEGFEVLMQQDGEDWFVFQGTFLTDSGEGVIDQLGNNAVALYSGATPG